MSLTFEIDTLGCKVNEYESQFYADQLAKLGLLPKQEGQAADVIVINTCTVTNTAASKSRQKIRKAKRENPQALCVVVGCYAQTMEEEVKASLEADLLIGASHKSELGLLVLKALEKQDRLSTVEPIEAIVDFESMPIGHFEHQHRAFLKIQDGCNQYCAYCQIPLARGPERSQSPDKVIEIAQNLAQKGHQEIVLTGIHTGRYRFRATHLTDLLKSLLEAVPESVCFRLSSIEITEVSDELIELMQKEPRLLPHLHIPIQSGCNATLARMKRPYTVEQFKEKAAAIRKAIPDISISTDVICGFPMESEEEFETTRATLEEIGFSFLHVFPYSRRKGTAADAMSGFVDSATAKARTSALLDLSRTLRKKDMERFSDVEVLVEREDPHHKGQYLGYSAQYHPVSVQSDTPLSGRIKANVQAIEEGVYIASVVDEAQEQSQETSAGKDML